MYVCMYAYMIMIPGGITVLSITKTKSFKMQRLDKTQFLPMKQPVPITAASTTQSSPINECEPIVNGMNRNPFKSVNPGRMTVLDSIWQYLFKMIAAKSPRMMTSSPIQQRPLGISTACGLQINDPRLIIFPFDDVKQSFSSYKIIGLNIIFILSAGKIKVVITASLNCIYMGYANICLRSGRS